MSVFGVFKPQYGQIIPPAWFWGVADGLDFFYFYGVPNQGQDFTPTLDASFDVGKPDRRFREAHFLRGYFDQEVYVQGRRVIKDQDPVYIAGFIEQAQQDLSLIKHYLRYAASGRGIKTRALRVATSPTPLFVDELDCRRIILKVDPKSLYMVYIGDSASQDFPVAPGEQIELNVKDPRQVYVRSEQEANIFLLFELAQ